MTNEELIEKYVPKDLKSQALEKLKRGYPVQYIIGNVDFFRYIFSVNENVLIPRFETETLVEKTIAYIKKIGLINLKIADLGTGSGCIGITLEKELNAEVTCFDISKSALIVAKKNKEMLFSNIKLIEHDILNKIPGKYNVLISNPPYISNDEYVEDLVKNNEPNIALYAEKNGLLFYEKILGYASEVVEEKFIISFEIGCTQGAEIKKIAQEKFPNSIVLIEKDLTNKDRYVFVINE